MLDEKIKIFGKNIWFSDNKSVGIDSQDNFWSMGDLAHVVHVVRF